MQPREFFRLEQLQEEFDLATEADLNANRRFQMLRLRDCEVSEFRNAKMVAPFEREIPRDAFLVRNDTCVCEREVSKRFF